MFATNTSVATVLTVYGIETARYIFLATVYYCCNSTYRLRYWNPENNTFKVLQIIEVATVLTVYGIETLQSHFRRSLNFFELQQYLPFTVLKRSINVEPAVTNMIRCNSTYRLRYWNLIRYWNFSLLKILLLQQYLPFTVLKPFHNQQ